MKPGPYTIVGLGELLWDLLPSGKQLGGAPTNFAHDCAALGDRGFVASRVGRDDLGQEALQKVEQLGLTMTHIQQDDAHPTGTVPVRLDDRGQPDFTITQEVAWDYLEWTPEWKALAIQADVICFGSLAQRSPQARETILSFLRATRPDALRVFDVNLRQSFYSGEVISTSLRSSQIVKLNSDELPRLMDILGLGSGTLQEGATRLRRAFNLELVCVTRGDEGSFLVSETQSVEHPGFKVTVADTIGSGDAFTAALVHFYLRNAPLERTSIAANRLGSYVASQVGGTPIIPPNVLAQIRADGEG